MKYKPLLTWGAVAAVLAFVLVLGARDNANAGTFVPTLTVQTSSMEPETTADYTVEFGIGPNDVNFAAVVAFIPPDWGVVPGDQMPVGTPVGSLQSQATLGLLNSACNQQLPVAFDFMNSSINTGETVSFLDVDEDNTADYAEDDDSDGLANAIEQYPEFLNRLFTEEDEETPLQPIRRSAGITLVAGIPVLLQFLIFPPGTVINPELPADPERGFPSVTVLQNAGDPDAEPQPGAITDFCAPLATMNTSLGLTTSDEGEEPLFVTPLAGTHEFSVVSFGLRDADDDGYENALDTCSQQPNTGSPKVTNDGDLDNDGLDATCDPNDDPAAGGTDSDEDADGYSNRQDNCPLDPNGQAEASDPTGNQQDTDTDQIGDACDTEPETPSGELGFSDIKQEIVIGGGGAGGPPACAAEGGANGANCWYDGYVLDPAFVGEGAGGQDTGTPTEETTPADGSPTEAAEENGDDDDDGGSDGLLIGGGIAALAAIAIIGGGAFLLMRRRNA